MMYFIPSSSSYRKFKTAQGTVELPQDVIGCIATPKSGMPVSVTEGYTWIGDNMAFTQGFNPDVFFPWLDRMANYGETCAFVACPDVVGDALRTIALYRQYQPDISRRGFPVAFVAQDGQEDLPLPHCQAIFIGGSTKWKMSEAARSVIFEARMRTAWVHIGRVNGRSRFKAFALDGADSADGTYLKYEPSRRWKKIVHWTRQPTFSRSAFDHDTSDALGDFSDWAHDNEISGDPDDEYSYQAAWLEYRRRNIEASFWNPLQ